MGHFSVGGDPAAFLSSAQPVKTTTAKHQGITERIVHLVVSWIPLTVEIGTNDTNLKRQRGNTIDLAGVPG